MDEKTKKNVKTAAEAAEEKKDEKSAETPVTEEMTVFGRIDRKIMKHRTDKAEKKARKEKEKADKAASKEETSNEKKKFPWKTAAIVGSSILIGGGAALLGKDFIENHEDPYELDDDSCLPEDAGYSCESLPEAACDGSVEAEKIPA